MNKQPPIKPPDSWEELISRLLTLYAKSLLKISDSNTESVSDGDFRKDIRTKIAEIGRTLDETEKNYNELIEKYGELKP